SRSVPDRQSSLGDSIMRNRHRRPYLPRHWTLENLDSRCLPSITPLPLIELDAMQPAGVDDLNAIQVAGAVEQSITPSRTNAFLETDLVTDQTPKTGQQQDTHLVNPWGLALSPMGGAFWVSDNGTDVATLYSGDVAGSPLTIGSLVVNIPGGEPTGQVFNGSNDFVVHNG